MASTSDLAPSGRKPPVRTESKSREEQLEEQVMQLQADLKTITATLAKLTSEKVSDAKRAASGEIDKVRQQGQNVIEDVQDQAGQLEQQLKDTIREKPLTAVASAIGIGFVLALLSRH
jgi:ElaB/YqjD/DUF883 family membrane-anchored ribosome-binding protein